MMRFVVVPLQRQSRSASVLDTVVSLRLLIVLLPMTFPSIGLAQSLSLAPSLPSGQPVGTSISWEAAVVPAGAPREYRFSIAYEDNATRVVKDYEDTSTWDWLPLEEGTYLIRADSRMQDTHDQVVTNSASYEITSRLGAAETAAVLTSHPMVALLSTQSCPLESSMLVQFRTAGSTEAWRRTSPKDCLANRTMNFWVAGMRASTAYELQAVLIAADGAEEERSVVNIQTGAATYTLPDVTVEDPADGATSTADQVLFVSAFGSGVNPLPLALDLQGELIWYFPGYSERIAVSTNLNEGGTVLLLAGDESDVQGQLLQEVDLVGTVVRQTTARRVSEQLQALGMDEIGSFDHEAVRFPDGTTLVQGGVERLMTNVQGSVGQVDILGGMIIALDEDWQVKWAWNTFDHIDINRRATLNEKCYDGLPGCPPLFLDDVANDWIHGNTIVYSQSDGNLLYSMRSQDWVIKIDYKDGAGSGDIVWSLGPDGTIQLSSGTDEDWFTHQHGPRYIDPSKIAIFDNGNVRCSGDLQCMSRGQVWNIDETDRVASVSLNHEMAYSLALGMAQKLTNGNLLFTSGWQRDNTGESTELTADSIATFAIRIDTNLYRTWRVPNLYAPTFQLYETAVPVGAPSRFIVCMGVAMILAAPAVSRRDSSRAQAILLAPVYRSRC
ncbi:MAG: aryl-sulfate sulfotransferase [Candidatus Schekmanbacteria bacterium]|nr:aryl-sulfate sulfotransferase [Candidatus Schekmanbacteria bacterium]